MFSHSVDDSEQTVHFLQEEAVEGCVAASTLHQVLNCVLKSHVFKLASTIHSSSQNVTSSLLRAVWPVL